MVEALSLYKWLNASFPACIFVNDETSNWWTLRRSLRSLTTPLAIQALQTWFLRKSKVNLKIVLRSFVSLTEFTHLWHLVNETISLPRTHRKALDKDGQKPAFQKGMKTKVEVRKLVLFSIKTKECEMLLIWIWCYTDYFTFLFKIRSHITLKDKST